MTKSNEERLHKTILNLDKHKEIINWTAKLDPDQPYLDFFGIRASPKEYIEKEIAWYMSQELAVDKIAPYAGLWQKYADKTTNEVNSNYGWCIFSEENGSQYDNVLHKLLTRPTTKQACMIYTRPSMHTDATKGGRKDFICTNYVQCFLRPHNHTQDKLIYIVHQRSCDFVYGFFNDFAWHCYVYNMLINDLRIKSGKSFRETDIIYICDTLHIYEKHYEMIHSIADKIKENSNAI